MDSGAIGLGAFAGCSFLKHGAIGRPILVTGCAGGRLRSVARAANIICVFEIFATVAAVYALRKQFVRTKIVAFMNNEVACKSSCVLT